MVRFQQPRHGDGNDGNHLAAHGGDSTDGDGVLLLEDCLCTEKEGGPCCGDCRPTADYLWRI